MLFLFFRINFYFLGFTSIIYVVFRFFRIYFYFLGFISIFLCFVSTFYVLFLFFRLSQNIPKKMGWEMGWDGMG